MLGASVLLLLSFLTPIGLGCPVYKTGRKSPLPKAGKQDTIVIFEEHPEVKKEMWGGEFWGDGYFARTEGDRVTAETIRKYIEYHHDEGNSPKQLKFF